MPELRTTLLKNIVNKEVSLYDVSEIIGPQGMLKYELFLV
jgi:hypothetical protein